MTPPRPRERLGPPLRRSPARAPVTHCGGTASHACLTGISPKVYV